MGRRSGRVPQIRQKKSLGQVFLRTEWPVVKVVEKLEELKVRRVVEIGPGGGVLTRALLDAGLHVTAIEKDDRFAEKLEEYARTRGGDRPGSLEIRNQDILKFDLEEWIASSKEPCAVVGNIPYNISTPIVMWLLPYLKDIRGAVFMVQLEFAQRLAGSADTKAYGSLSVFTQLRSKVEMISKVERFCFHPVPKVDSALISLQERKPQLDEDLLHKVEKITRMAFTQRRKKLRNATRSFINEEMEKDCPIDLNRRADSLRPEEFVELARFAFQPKK